MSHASVMPLPPDQLVEPPIRVSAEPAAARSSQYEQLWDDYSRWWDSEAGLSKQYQHLGDEWGDDAWAQRNVDSFVLPYLSKDSKVLEIGPGGGRYTAPVAEHCAQVFGVDVSSLMVERLRNRFGINNRHIFFKGNGYDLSDVPDDYLDFVFSFNVFVQLEFEDIVSYLKEIKRVLKPGGKAALHYATISNQDGWVYFLDHCRDWRNHPKPRGRFCELTLDTMALLAKRLSLRLLTNQPVGRDAMLVLEKPQPQAEAPPGSWLRVPDRTAVSYPILFPKGTNFFFLVGSMRSGTTWLMDLLNSHPDVCCHGEMHPIEVMDLSLPSLESVSRNSFGLKQWYAMPNNAWNVPFRAEGDSHEYLERDLVRFFFEWTLFRFVQSQGPAMPRFIGDKSPSHTRFITRKLKSHFGGYEPFVLHIVRDPRDAAVSRWFHTRTLQRLGKIEFAPPFRGHDDKLACENLIDDPEGYLRHHPFFYYPNFLPDVFDEWLDVNRSLLREGRETFGERYLMVKYEDLKSDLAGNLMKIFRWFGVNGAPSLIAEIMERNDVTRMTQRRSTFRKGTTGEWKRYFSPQDIALFTSRVLPLSREFGYE
jgi:SAM-dependent methyltransferase